MTALRSTTVGSYPVPGWLTALPSEAAVIDATRVVFATQREAGIDLPTDGELYRFDINHPDTNGMIDYFTGAIAGIRCRVGRSDAEAFRRQPGMSFRAKPAGVVEGPLGEGCLDLATDCRRAAAVAGGPFKFTLTSPYMLARSLLDRHYGSLEDLVPALADVLAEQVTGLPCAALQVDEANLPGCPEHAALAADAVNRILDRFEGESAVHLCFGNYGGQTIQQGDWKSLLGFLNALHTDVIVPEIAHRPATDLLALRDVDPRIGLGIGVIDIKVNDVESADDVARRLEHAAGIVGADRLRYAHPDCGFWMLKRSVADRKMHALAEGVRTWNGTQTAR